MGDFNKVLSQNENHISKIRKGLIIHPPRNVDFGTNTKIPMSPNIKNKRRKAKAKGKTENSDAAESKVAPTNNSISSTTSKTVEDKSKVAPTNNSISSIATLTNIVPVTDNQLPLSEHQSRFLEETHRIKVNEAAAGLKRPSEEKPFFFYAWKNSVDTQTAAAVPLSFATRNPPFAWDDEKTSSWKTEYSEKFSFLPSSFYSNTVVQKPLETNDLLNIDTAVDLDLVLRSPKKVKPSEIDLTRAGMPSRKIPSVVIPSFLAWTSDHQIDRDETDIGGKRVNIIYRPPDSPHNVIIKSDEGSVLDTEYSRMFISPPADFVARLPNVKRVPKSPIVLFTEFQPISEQEGPPYDRPSAPVPNIQLEHPDLEEELKSILANQKDIVCKDIIETSKDFFIPIHKIKTKDENWVVIDNPVVSDSAAINWITPSKQIVNKKQKVMRSIEKKDLGSSVSATNLMTTQQFKSVIKNEKSKSDSKSEYDSKFTNHFASGTSNFIPPKKRKYVSVY